MQGGSALDRVEWRRQYRNEVASGPNPVGRATTGRPRAGLEWKTVEEPKGDEMAKNLQSGCLAEHLVVDDVTHQLLSGMDHDTLSTATARESDIKLAV